MAMCIGSERWEGLPKDLQRGIVFLVRHAEEGMTTMRDQAILLRVLALWLDFCDPADVTEFIETMPEYNEEEPEDIEFACQD